MLTRLLHSDTKSAFPHPHRSDPVTLNFSLTDTGLLLKALLRPLSRYTPPPRIIRPVQGNGPITDLTLIDLQCGGYTAEGIVGSSPAFLTLGSRCTLEISAYWLRRSVKCVTE